MLIFPNLLFIYAYNDTLQFAWCQAIPEVAAFRVMTLLCKHSCQEVHNKEHPVALMAPPNVLAVMAAGACTQAHGRLSNSVWAPYVEVYSLHYAQAV